MTHARRSAFRVIAVALLTAVTQGTAPVAAQSPGDLRSECTASGGTLDRCTDVAIGARALVGEFSLLAGGGSEIPGSASTLGTKIGNRPRLSASLRFAAGWVGLPDVFDEGLGTAGDVSFLVPVLQLGLAAGLLDGFSPMATVGGVLSLDLFGSAALAMPPSSQGFEGNSTGVTVGARVGLVRESFTLPGVSVSVARRVMGATRLGDMELGDPAYIEIRPSVSSMRATIGKDLFGIGVLAGVGWDRASSDTVLEVQGPGSVPVRVASPLDATRRLYFGSAAMHFVLLQVSLEGGWAEGYDPVPGGAGSGFDPTGGTPFGGLSLRLTP